jgi:hypothetical protein
MNFGDVFMAFFMGIPLDQEEFDKFFDESFIKYFRDVPNGYDEVMRLIDEKAPEDSKDMIRERMNKIYEQSKKGGNDDDHHQ